MKTTETLPVGVIVERRLTQNRWVDHTWKCVAIVPGATGFQEWKKIGSGPDWERFFAATLHLQLHKGETEGYRVNLSQRNPTIYVVLHHLTEEFPKAVLVTACPFEAEDNDVSGDESVDQILMPAEIISFVAHFVEQYHEQQPFRKRKRKKYFSDTDPSKATPRGRRTAKLAGNRRKDISLGGENDINSPEESITTEDNKSEHAKLPPIETLDSKSDFTPFLKKGVSHLLKRAALRKLWKTDPILANLDGLNDYDEDFVRMSAGKIVKSAYTISQNFIAKHTESVIKNDGEEVQNATNNESEQQESEPQRTAEPDISQQTDPDGEAS